MDFNVQNLKTTIKNYRNLKFSFINYLHLNLFYIILKFFIL